MAIVVIVNRVRLRLTDDASIDNIGLGNEADLGDFLFRQRDQFLVARVPQTVALEAEVFETERSSCLRRHFRGPRTEILHASHFHRRIVDVDPVVREQLRLFHDQGDGKEIAVTQGLRMKG